MLPFPCESHITIMFNTLVGYVVDMLMTDHNVVKFSQHSNLSQHRFLEIPHRKGVPDNDPEKKMAFFIFYCIFELLGQTEYNAPKNKKELLKVFFFA